MVLATDYENYALLYSCENDGDEYRRGELSLNIIVILVRVSLINSFIELYQDFGIKGNQKKTDLKIIAMMYYFSMERSAQQDSSNRRSR